MFIFTLFLYSKVEIFDLKLKIQKKFQCYYIIQRINTSYLHYKSFRKHISWICSVPLDEANISVVLNPTPLTFIGWFAVMKFPGQSQKHYSSFFTPDCFLIFSAAYFDFKKLSA